MVLRPSSCRFLRNGCWWRSEDQNVLPQINALCSKVSFSTFWSSSVPPDATSPKLVCPASSQKSFRDRKQAVLSDASVWLHRIVLCCRKNDPVSRPHSWHSSKLTEEEPESAKREANPAAVWQPKHEARWASLLAQYGRRLIVSPDLLSCKQ